MERPQLSALRTMLDDLRNTLDNAVETQRKIFEVTGTAWSDDRMIKAVVGPRGQLIELEIDPRVYRRPNSKALAASIVATVRMAVEEAVSRTQEILDQSMPRDISTGRIGNLDVRRLIRSHDADLKAIAAEGDDVELP
jgi:DNA-binding protein YbaB